MKLLLPLLAIPAASAAPNFDPQHPLSIISQAVSSFGLDGRLGDTISRLWNGKHAKEVKSWMNMDDDKQMRTFVEQNGITYELLTHPDFPEYKIRLKSPKLCDPNVKQYSGYLDIDDDKHLFFW